MFEKPIPSRAVALISLFTLLIAISFASPSLAQQAQTPRTFDNANNPTPFTYTDWAPSEFKGECAPGGPVKGLSASPTTNKAHSILCKSPRTSALNYYDSHNPLMSTYPKTEIFSTSNSADFLSKHFDWDLNYLKGECPDGAFVIGVSQTSSGALDHLLCSADSNTSAPVFPYASWGGCVTRTLPGNQPASLPDGDWATNFSKLGCGSNEVMVGVSTDPSTHAPHRILCCNLFTAQAGVSQTCPAVPPPAAEVLGGCETALWPNGLVQYKITNKGAFPTQEVNIRKAMDDWETLTSGVITFVESPSAPDSAVTRITVASDGSGGEAQFGPGGTAFLSAWSAYHELGHVLGIVHEFERRDRNHYASINHTSYYDTAGTLPYPRCLDSDGDFGPHAYRSVDSYLNVTYPDITRWDGTPLNSSSCDPRVAKGSPAPPLWFTLSCPPFNPNFPNDLSGCQSVSPGVLTRGDGAKVVEMYKYATGGWDKFRRTESEPTTATPYPSTFATNVPINGSPAVATNYESGGSLMVFGRGTDDKIYYKRDAVFRAAHFTWGGGWTLVQNGTFTSDPAVVSWGLGRVDLVARGGDNAIWSNTFSNNTTWGAGFDSLGAPTVGAASAPAITSWGPGRLDVFVRGTDNKLYWRRCSTTGTDCTPSSGNWNAWQVVSTTLTFKGKPTAATRNGNTIDVFVHGMDDRIKGIEFANNQWLGEYDAGLSNQPIGWNNFSVSSGSCTSDDCYSPAVTSRSDGLDIVIRGSDEKAWVASWTVGQSSWAGLTPIGGLLTSSPGLPSSLRSTYHIDLIATMDEERDWGQFVPTIWWKRYPKP